MAEYIDKQKLIDILEAKADMAVPDYKPVLSSVAKMVQLLPATDVAPVRHGHWIDREDDYGSYVECSLCGDEYSNWEADCAKTKFCPGCGARMDGGAGNGE